MNEMIGINIRVRREQKGWTQVHLAEAAALTERTIQRAEQGEGIHKDSLLSIASALDSSVEDLRFDPFETLAHAFGVPRDQLTPELVEQKSKEWDEKRAAEERKFNEKYLKVPLTRITRASAFGIATKAYAVQTTPMCELSCHRARTAAAGCARLLAAGRSSQKGSSSDSLSSMAWTVLR